MTPPWGRRVVIGTLTDGVRLVGPKALEAFRDTTPAPDREEVLVRVQFVGLCATDLALYDGTYEAPNVYPVCFGHEWSGVVEQVGPEVPRVVAGDRVTGECSLWCGECAYCSRDLNLCQRIRKFGITTDGAARSTLLIDQRYLHRADPGTDAATLALAEPLAVAAHGIERALAARSADLRSARVLILGAGMIGLACLLVLRHLHDCRSVAVLDPIEARLRRASRLGAVVPEDMVTAGRPAESYARLYGGDGHDLVIETSGSPTAWPGLLDLVRPNGAVLCLGFVAHSEIHPRLLTLKAVHLLGSIGGSGNFDAAVRLCAQQGPLLREHLITHVLPLKEVGKAFRVAADRERALKVLIELPEGELQ